MNVTAIVVAGGSSSRMKANKSKLLMNINGKTVIQKSVEVLNSCDLINEIIVVTRLEDMDEISKQCDGISKLKHITLGGASRQESVFNGVKLCENCDFIAIHDGARPLVKKDDIEKVILSAIDFGASTLAVKVKDTIKQSNENQIVVATPNRESLWQVQTPQVFDYKLYIKATQKAKSQNLDFTDDCQLVENIGLKVKLCEGDYSNIKITTPEDIQIAEALGKRSKLMMRIGHGYDVHKLVEGRKLILGGVEIPHEKGLLGHSDADVLLHAISDALLGACAMRDIGNMFPDTDEQYKGADSLILLEKVVNAVHEKGYKIGNIDATIIAQAPKLKDFIEKMNENIAQACSVSLDCINVKATTEEKLGFTGRKEGISAHAVATIFPI